MDHLGLVVLLLLPNSVVHILGGLQLRQPVVDLLGLVAYLRLVLVDYLQGVIEIYVHSCIVRLGDASVG
jgi:hypothetical protein